MSDSSPGREPRMNHRGEMTLAYDEGTIYDFDCKTHAAFVCEACGRNAAARAEPTGVVTVFIVPLEAGGKRSRENLVCMCPVHATEMREGRLKWPPD
ncbi:MAG: zinc-binding metallopeptidase family protein [Candidatus Dormibacteria bacterium]